MRQSRNKFAPISEHLPPVVTDWLTLLLRSADLMFGRTAACGHQLCSTLYFILLNSTSPLPEAKIAGRKLRKPSPTLWLYPETS
jgi:hypothetical protein